jgi:hypothetical protein
MREFKTYSDILPLDSKHIQKVSVFEEYTQPDIRDLYKLDRKKGSILHFHSRHTQLLDLDQHMDS